MDEEYFNSIKNWRKEYEMELGAPDGWLSISGLYWLSEGDNRMGTDLKSEVVLPPHTAPKLAAVFNLKGTHITLTPVVSELITFNDQPVSSMDVTLNEYGSSEPFFINDVKFFVIQRGTRFGVRVYDKNNPARRKFHNIRWYPVEENFRFQVRLIPLDPPITIPIVNVLGNVSDEISPGYVEFTVKDQVCRLYPVIMAGDDRFWFMFKDATCGSMSFAGGRFLWIDSSQDGWIDLDFNKANNPPCAYTDFATCPLPPAINTLPVGILAGEMSFVGN